MKILSHRVRTRADPYGYIIDRLSRNFLKAALLTDMLRNKYDSLIKARKGIYSIAVCYRRKRFREPRALSRLFG